MDTSDETQSLFPRIDRSKKRRSYLCFLVLFLSHVFVLADQQALAVLIPSGIQCNTYSNLSCYIGKSNTTAQPTTVLYGRDQGIQVTAEYIISTWSSDGHFCDPEKCISFSNVEQGVLTGPAYMFLYCIVSVVPSRLHDGRTRVFTFGLTVTLAMVLLTTFSKNYVGLLMARIGVGIGAALSNPISLVADYFDRDKALSFYIYGIYFGGAAGYALSAISTHYCWRWVFGTIATVLTVSVLLSPFVLREPGRVLVSTPFDREYTFKETFHTIRTCKAFYFLSAGASIRAMGWFALMAWLPTYYAKVYHSDTNEFGLVLATIVLLGGGIGSLFAAYIADRFSEHQRPGKAYLASLVQLVAVPCTVSALIVDDVRLSYGLLSMGYLTAETWLGYTTAIVQGLFPPNMRHQAVFVYITIYTFIGGCAGPLLVPALMQAKTEWAHCDHGVGPALGIVVTGTYSLAAVLFGVVGCLMKDGDPPTEETIIMSYETSDLEYEMSTEVELPI